MTTTVRIVGGVALSLLIVAVLSVGVLVYQGKRKPVGDARYVALGSSFAAGIGLGPRVPGSPFVCMRSANGYPGQLSRLLGLPLLDMSCSAATTAHVLRGGQIFQGAQLAALTSATELVTLTTGGNDVRFIGDTSFLAARRSGAVTGWLLRKLWNGPLRPEQRDFAGLHRDLIATFAEIRRRAPRARIVVVTYPLVLPPEGSCARLSLDPAEVAAMRTVGERLAEVTRSAAHQGGVVVVDLQRLGATHHACSAEPWVNGWQDAQGTQFHPTIAGARAAAAAIAAALGAHRES